jgi:small subunit ribosomal protein S4
VPSLTREQGEQLFVTELETIESAIRFACGRAGLRNADAEDFASEVKMRLIEDDYAVLRAFESRSKFRTFINIVIHRMLVDRRTQQWGRWHSSAEAKRLGPFAVELERELAPLRAPGAAEKLSKLFDATPEELAAAANRARVHAVAPAKPAGQVRRRGRSKMLGYGLHLREKQKVQRIYGVLEYQFSQYFKRKVEQNLTITGERLLRQLALRLDHVVYALGFATSRAQSRMLVRHGHIEVNGQTIDMPSYQVRRGDVIEVGEKSRTNEQIRHAIAETDRSSVPPWLELQADRFRGIVTDVPKHEDQSLPIPKDLGSTVWSKE